MVGLVIISHSAKLAEGAKELAAQMAPGVAIAAAGGLEDGGIGTDIFRISQAIEDVYSDDGVIMLFDLGSAFMNSEMALENLEEHMREKVHIVDAAIAEGSIIAAVDCSLDKTIEEIKTSLKDVALAKIPN